MADPVAELRGITKHFGSTLALDGISLAVQPGAALGLLGPNGAGKTTAVKIILGLTHATGGAGTLLGRPFGDQIGRAHV